MSFTENEIAQYTALLARYPNFTPPDGAREDDAAEYCARRMFCPHDDGLTNSRLGKASLEEEIYRSKGRNRVLYPYQRSTAATVVTAQAGQVR